MLNDIWHIVHKPCRIGFHIYVYFFNLYQIVSKVRALQHHADTFFTLCKAWQLYNFSIGH